MSGTELIGLFAGLLTTAANVPQVLKTWRERSGDGLSRRMLIALSAGLAVWIAYGVLKGDVPIIATNSVALLLALSLLGLKRRFSRTHTHPSHSAKDNSTTPFTGTKAKLEYRVER